jgi:hypothetical protein
MLLAATLWLISCSTIANDAPVSRHSRKRPLTTCQGRNPPHRKALRIGVKVNVAYKTRAPAGFRLRWQYPADFPQNPANFGD